MESQELIDALRRQLDQVERQGNKYVQVSALRAYLDAMEKDAHDTQEHRQREHAGMLANYAAQNQHNIEMLKAVLEAGKSALHALLLINGGAVIALLGMLSTLVGKEQGQALASELAFPLLLFGIGVLAGALGFAFRYFSQAFYSEGRKDSENDKKWGDRFRKSAIAVGIGGCVTFGAGIFCSYRALVGAFPT